MNLLRGNCMEILPTLRDSADVIIADPPYGISYQSAWSQKSLRKDKLENDELPYIWWLYDAFWALKDPGALVCFCEWRHQDVFKMAIQAAGFQIRSQVIWDREWNGMGDLSSQFAPQHDTIWFATKGNYVFPSSRPKSVLRSRRLPASQLIHPTEKPVDLMEQLVLALSKPGDVILDPFMGSGSSGEASIRNGRNYIGIEIKPNYFVDAKVRLEEIAA